MSASRLYLGVDGGGTKTEFLCLDEGGRIIARTTTPTTYHLQIGLDRAVRHIKEGVTTVCDMLGATPEAFAYTFFGLPAYGEDAAIDPQLETACGEILGNGRYRCGNDMICGWAGSLACEDGINLVAGTGSIGYGERRGRAARVGGWGEVFGDEGSAYWIAIQALNAFSRMSDGRQPAGPLHAMLRDRLALDADLDLCARIMGERGMPRTEIAGLAVLVSEAADAGDAIARSILEQAARELAAMASALRAALGYEPSEPAHISCSGGVVTGGTRTGALLGQMLAADGDFAPIEPRHGPAVGAALYARLLDKTER